MCAARPAGGATSPARSVRTAAACLAIAVLCSGCFWRWFGDDGPVLTPGRFGDPQGLCAQAGRGLGRELQPWRSRAPGHYNCLASTPAFGVASGPMRSTVMLHAHGRDPQSARAIALQANVMHPADAQSAFAMLERLVQETFSYFGEPLPDRLRQALVERTPATVGRADLRMAWSATELGRGAVSWSLLLDSGVAP